MYQVTARSEMPYETRTEFTGVDRTPRLKVVQATKQWKAKTIARVRVELPRL